MREPNAAPIGAPYRTVHTVHAPTCIRKRKLCIILRYGNHQELVFKDGPIIKATIMKDMNHSKKCLL